MGILDNVTSDVLQQVSQQGAQVRATNEAVEGRQASQQQLQDLSNQLLEMTAPYRSGGERSFEEYNALLSPEGRQQFLSGYSQTPEYQNQLQGGVAALEQSAVAGGALGTGGFGKGLVDYGQNLAATGGQQAYQQRLGQLGQGAGFGLQGLGLTTPYTAQIGGNIAGLTTDIGDTRSAGLLGLSNLQRNQQLEQQFRQQQQGGTFGGLLGAGLGGYFGGLPGAQAGAGIGQQFGALV